MRHGFLFIVCFTNLIACGGNESAGSSGPIQTAGSERSFYMGFTPFAYDFTTEALNRTYDIVNTEGDLVIHHMDNGIPWTEALAGTYPYDNNIMSDWSTRLAKSSATHKKFVIISPIAPSRDKLAQYRKDQNDMPNPLPFSAHETNQAFDHADVKTAYLNYARRVINYFNPDYFGIGIEVNLLRRATDAATWNKYMNLQVHIYTQLKVEFPNLPILASVEALEAVDGYGLWVPGEFAGNSTLYAQSQAQAIDDVLTASDYYAISLYPHKTKYYASPFPSDMMDSLFALNGGKPIAIAETGMTAENFSADFWDFEGDSQKQQLFVKDLLEKSNTADVEFISWFVPQDYDDLCGNFPGGCPDAFLYWKDSGLYNENSTARPAHTTWMEFFNKDLK